MSTRATIELTIIIISLIFVLTMLFFIGKILWKRHFLTKKDFSDTYTEQLIDSPLAKLSRVDSIISYHNVVIRKATELGRDVSEMEAQRADLQDLSYKLNALIEKMNITRTKIGKLLANYNHFFKEGEVTRKTNKAHIVMIENAINEFLDYKNELDEVFSVVEKNDSFVRNRYEILKKQLKDTNDEYEKLSGLPKRYKVKIDSIISLAIDKQRDIEDMIHKLNYDKAETHLEKFTKYIKRFAVVTMNIPELYNVYKNVIPEMGEKIHAKYKYLKNEMKMNLNHLNFTNSFKASSELYVNLSKQLDDLNISKSIDLSKRIIRGLDAMRNMIDLEIESQKILTIKYEAIITSTSKYLKDAYKLRKDFKYKREHKNFNQLIKNNFQVFVKQYKRVDQFGMNFRDTYKDKTLPYSSHFSNANQLLHEIKILANAIDDLTSSIYEFESREINTRNSFIMSEAAINSIFAAIKSEDIQLENNVQDMIDKMILERKRLSIELDKDNLEEQVHGDVKNFARNAGSLCAELNKSVIIAFHLRNIIKELGPMRALDPQINLRLNSVESLYLDGKYEKSLAEALPIIRKEQ